MNFFKRSLKYIKSKKLKTVLLGIIFFLVGNLVIVGFGVSQASENAKTLARKKMNPIVKYTENENNYYYSMDDYEYIDLKIADEMASDKRVKAASAFATFEAFSVDFEAVEPENKGMFGYDEGDSEYLTDVTEDGDYEEQNITLKGNRYPNLIEFENGTYEMVEGKFYNNDDIKNKNNVVVIEKDLAKKNNLKVGDIIDIKIMSDSDAKEYKISDDERIISLKIIGIYKSNVDGNTASWTAAHKSNLLLVPAASFVDLVLDITKKEYEYYSEMYGETLDFEIKEELFYSTGVSYLLNDPDDLDKFVEDYSGKISKKYKLDLNDDSFKKYSKPLDTISLFAKIIVWAFVINSIVIISLVTALTLKTREYEIGVLVSLGVQKWKVVMQLFLELLIIAMVSFVLATVSGSMVSQSVGKKVLDFQSSLSDKDEKENEEEYETYYYYDDNNYFTEISQDDIFSEYKVTVDALLIVKIFVMGLFIVFVSILAPALMILRYNPKQILMSTN